MQDETRQRRGEEHAVEDGFGWLLQELKRAICCGAARQKPGSGHFGDSELRFLGGTQLRQELMHCECLGHGQLVCACRK